jgi:hypothetical protein
MHQSVEDPMKHSLTAMLAIVSAAGVAGIAQAQTTAPLTTAPSQSYQGTAPYNQYQSTAAPAYQTAPATAPMVAPSTAPQASMQQPTGMQPTSRDPYWGRNLTQDDVRQAQQQLQAQGLYRGPIDGLIGSGTKRALARFQRQNGLPLTAMLDEQTMQRLSGTATASAGASTTPPATTPSLGAGGGNYNGQNAYTQPLPR